MEDIGCCYFVTSKSSWVSCQGYDQDILSITIIICWIVFDVKVDDRLLFQFLCLQKINFYVSYNFVMKPYNIDWSINAKPVCKV